VVDAGADARSVALSEVDASADLRSIGEQSYTRHGGKLRVVSAAFSQLTEEQAVGTPSSGLANFLSVASEHGTTSEVIFCPTVGGSVDAMRRTLVHGLLTPTGDRVLAIRKGKGANYSTAITVTEER
jgi:hypothetical protein